MEIKLQWNELNENQKKQLYMNYIAIPINKGAVFSDGTSMFCSPMEPEPGDEVAIRCRTGKGNIEKVYLRYGDQKVGMYVAKSDEEFDYYEAVVPVSNEKISYYFELYLDHISYFYNQHGVHTSVDERYNFKIIPGFSTPDWSKGSIIYQILLDRFYNGDETNDVVDREYSYIDEHVASVKDWHKYPAPMGVREFYGGDLMGVKKKLDYLQELGVECIYFNPIFVSPSNHKYDIQDYDYMDPHYGVIVKDEGRPLEVGDMENIRATKYISRVTDKRNLEASNQFFIEFIREVHARGMKVILDGVFNHCGSFNKWMDKEKLYEQNADYDKGAYVDKNSPYRTFFKFREDAWPYNGTYDGWWGFNTLPKLNFEESPKLYQYIMDIGKKWVSEPYNADGWRLDVAADLGHSMEFNHKFWRDFRMAVKEANPNAIILAEHYGNPESWLQGDQWDTVMNYDAFMEPVSWFFTGMEKHSDEFRQDLIGNADAFFGAMRENMLKYANPSLLCAMNELSNHDHSRFLTRTNCMVGRTATHGPEAAELGVRKSIFRAAVVVQMTWPGAPTVYYGDEAGLCGWTDPDNRRTYPWGREDVELIRFHKELIHIHKDYSAFRKGSILFLKGEPYFISYGRFDDKDQFVVAVNSSGIEKRMDLPVWMLGIDGNSSMARLIQSSEHGFTRETEIIFVENGHITIKMPPFSAVIYKRFKE